MVSRHTSEPPEPEAACAELPRRQVKWCAVSVLEVAKGDKRLDASFYNIHGRQAKRTVELCVSGVVCLRTLLRNAHYPGRFKRTYCGSSRGVPFYLPSQITDINPKPEKHISALKKCNISELRLKHGDILLTRSGTVGDVSLVSKTFSDKAFSDDVIRISMIDSLNIGFLYAFFRTTTGNDLLRTSQYGSVIQHIEPDHLKGVPVPNPPDALKSKINDLIMRSYDLRDESNDMMDKATTLLAAELKLPPVGEIPVARFGGGGGALCYTVKLSELSGRLDGSYHAPLARAVEDHLRAHAGELLTIGDARVSKKIVLPGRFKRVYVGEGQGRVFIGGKQIGELDPSGKKYLSASGLSARARSELEISENAVLITRSGTIGRVAIAPRHWENWTASEHIIRVVPADSGVAGFLYIFLASRYGHALINRLTYGSVIDEIDANHVSQIPFPMLKDRSAQAEINRLALEANSLRSEAYDLERRAIKIMDDEVICAQANG